MALKNALITKLILKIQVLIELLKVLEIFFLN